MSLLIKIKNSYNQIEKEWTIVSNHSNTRGKDHTGIPIASAWPMCLE